MLRYTSTVLPGILFDASNVSITSLAYGERPDVITTGPMMGILVPPQRTMFCNHSFQRVCCWVAMFQPQMQVSIPLYNLWSKLYDHAKHQ